MKNISKYYNLILICILLVICIGIYVINSGNYPFIDNKETKFASIAKEMLNLNDWVNIRLNGEKIINYPPLFFWLTNLSCIIFGKINSFTVRFPISLMSCAGIILLYLSVKSILQKTYAIIIALIFSLSLGILFYSRLATYDILTAFLMMLCILAVYLLIFLKNEKFKPLLWGYIYFFSALSVLSGGIFGLIIPLVSTIAIMIFCGKSKELLNFKSMMIGIIIFIITLFPYNILMYIKYGNHYIKEYIDAYNIIKYSGVKEIFYSLGLFLLGFLPWAFSLIWVLGSKIKDIYNSVISYFKNNSDDKLREKWNKLRQAEKFLSVNTIVFFTSLIFSIIYGLKYNFLILFLMFPAACISGYYWYEYIIKNKHDKSIFFATLIPDLLLIICSLTALFGHNMLNTLITKGLNFLFVPLIIIFFIIPLIGIFAIILKGRIVVFISNIILMVSLSLVLTPSIFNFISMNSGENDLITYAQKVNAEKVSLSAFISEPKYSLVYYFDNYIKFYTNQDWNKLREYLNNNKNDYAVVEIKDLWTIEEKGIEYMLIDSGKKYCLIQYLPLYKKKVEEQNEPEVIIY